MSKNKSFAGLYKGRGVQGQSPGRAAHGAKFPIVKEVRKGMGNPTKGFPIGPAKAGPLFSTG